MVFLKPITKYITWAIVTSQIPLPVIADSDNEIQSWIAGTASSISPHLQEGTLEDYAKGKIKALPGQAANHLERGDKERFSGLFSVASILKMARNIAHQSSICLFPSRKQHRLYSLVSLAFATTTTAVSMAAPMLTLVWVTAEVNGWLLGVNTFLDADIRYSHLRGGIGGEVYKDSLAFSGNYYFPLTGWKMSAAHDYMMSVRHMALICEQRHAPRFSWFSGELTYEQYKGWVDLLGNGTLSRNPRAAGAALVWNPVPLLEVRAGYRDAGNGGSQAEGGLRVNYSFGTPLHEQLDYRNVGALSNTTNRRAFVDRITISSWRIGSRPAKSALRQCRCQACPGRW